MITRIFSAIGMIAIAVSAEAADIRVRSDGWVVVKGLLTNNDGLLFNMVVSTVKGKATVELEGEGGSVSSAILIGGTIRDRGFRTIVQANRSCLSACAFAWLGGTPRIMDRDAKIGLHGAFVLEGTTPVVSAPANAMLGAYMTKLGLPPVAIMYATDAKPEAFNWLDPKRAADVGIGIEVFVRPWERKWTTVQTVPIKETSKSKLVEELFRRAEKDEATGR